MMTEMAKEERSFHFRKMFDINPVRQVQNLVFDNGSARVADAKIESVNEGTPTPTPTTTPTPTPNEAGASAPASLEGQQNIETVLENKSPVSVSPLPEESVTPPPKESVTPSVSVSPLPEESVTPPPKESVTPPPKESVTPPPKESGPGGTSKKDKQISDMDMMKEKFAKLLLGEDMSGGGKGVSSALALSNAVTNLAASAFGEILRLAPMSADRKARWKMEVDWLLSGYYLPTYPRH